MTSKGLQKEILGLDLYLTPTQYTILEKLTEFGPLTRDELCKYFGFTKHKVAYTGPYPDRINKKRTIRRIVEQYDSRTTIYDNLVILEKKNFVERFSRNTGKRGRPPVLWRIKESKKPIKNINVPKLKSQEEGEKIVSGNLNRNSERSEKLRTETISIPSKSEKTVPKSEEAFCKTDREFIDEHTSTDSKPSEGDSYCEYLGNNRCTCKEPVECSFDKLMNCPATIPQNNENYVKVPINKQGKPKFKTYKIVKRLE